MAIPPWTIELLRRGLSDVAKRASEPETLEKLKSQASEMLQELPQTAARGIDAVMRATEAGRKNVQRWSQKQTAITIPLINASGTLYTPCGTGVPAATAAVDVAYACLHGNVRNDPYASQRVYRHLVRRLPAIGDLELAVASHFESSLTALVLGMGSRELVIHRSHAIRLFGGQPLVDTLNLLVPVVQEIGANDEVRSSDFTGMDDFGLILADDPNADAPPTLVDLPGRDVIQIVVLSAATLRIHDDSRIASVEATLNQGADLVIVEGGGIFGGPECGIIIGKKELVNEITSSPLWRSLQASQAVLAMLAATFEQSSGVGGEPLPIDALMQTSEENLKHRTERLATRFSSLESIKSASVTAADANVVVGGRWTFPSRQVRLEHQSKSAEEWAEELRGEIPSLLVGHDEQAILIDLRWVSPSSDNKIAELLGVKSEAALSN